MLQESATDGLIYSRPLSLFQCETGSRQGSRSSLNNEIHPMFMIKNDFEYRDWMMKTYFCLDDIQGETLLTAEELEDFLFDSRPASYPCLGMVTPSVGMPLENEISFVYSDQVSIWAKEMGVIKC